MLEAASITLARGRRPILERVSLAVRPGELLALIGPNGAGKSTLLACLAGTVQPQSGEIRLDGRPLSAFTPKELARRRAVLSQRLHVPPQLPLEDLVAFGRLPHRGRHAVQEERAILAAVIEEQRLGMLIGRTCGTLSGGELQRAHLARVTAQLRQDAPAFAPYLLLDEPTANLDPAFQDQILTQARRLAEDGAGVLAVLHDLNQAAQLADRLVVMAAGRVVADGPPEAVLSPDLVRRVYGIGTLTVPHPRSGRPILLSEIGPPAARPVQPEASHAAHHAG